MNVEEKYEKLKEILKDLDSVAVAFSGGVDSAFLLYAAKEALGDKAVAINAAAKFISEDERDDAILFCEKYGIRQLFYRADMNSIPHFTENPFDRCYHCKTALFSAFLAICEKEGIRYLAEGSNLDDEGDYRPGMKALAELDIKSPLREAGFTKSEIREMSKKLGLPTADKPSAACLASRFVYGQQTSAERLEMVEKAERFLHGLGFTQLRVRIYEFTGLNSGLIARLEFLPDDMEKAMRDPVREDIVSELKKTGFDYVTIDMQGFKSGSMNTFLN